MAARPPASRLPWHAIGAAGILVALTLAAIRAGLGLTGGRLVYAIDDPYIHMAIARNLVLHGSWGVNPGRFEPASSSPLWTLLLAAADRLVGVHDATPLVLNLLLAVAIVLTLDRMLRSFVARASVRAAIVLAIALAIPLPAVIATGMEAMLHVWLTLWLAWWVVGPRGPGAPGPDAAPPPGALRVALLSALCVLTRFESLFLIAALTPAALWRGRRSAALALLAGAAAALGGYMAFSLPRGGLWLPNPVLAKAPVAEFSTPDGILHALWRIPYQLIVRRYSHMTALLLASAWLLLPRPRPAPGRAAGVSVLLAVFVATTVVHIEFAGLGWFYRYEAYLMALGLLSVVAAVSGGVAILPGRSDRPRPRAALVAAALAALVLATPVATRTVRSFRRIGPAMRNIYEQQYQMAGLVRDHFRGRVVALNDLGAVGYYGGATVHDLMGLTTREVARARIEGRFDSGAIARYCADQGVEMAMVYRSWFSGPAAPPASWTPVARWTVPDEVSVGDTSVTILATDPSSTERVRAAVRSFSRGLPPRVRVELPE